MPDTPATDEEAIARRWIGEIETSEKDPRRKKWLERCDKIAKLYEEERAEADKSSKRFALFWSNMQTLIPAVYARTPTAVVTRRFKDADPVGRVASEVLERALNFSLESAHFADAMEGARDEFLLYARGAPWVRYVPTFAKQTAPAQGEGDAGQVGDGTPVETVSWEEVQADRVHHKDLFHNVARSWKEVWWQGRRVQMTREQLVERFPECGALVPLEWTPPDMPDAADTDKRAEVFEIWDSRGRQVIWICRGYPSRPLDVRPDPLKLKGFYPAPKPAYGTLGTSSLIPIPDYMYWQDQGAEINQLTQRIDGLIDALKVRGFYSSANETDLNTLLAAENNMLIPVDSWAALGDKGGVKGIIDWFPLDQVAAALKECFAVRKELISDVYQLTGISDIQRGDTDPDETAAAQQLKASWGSARIRPRQKELSRMARDTIEIMAEVIASKFGQDVLAEMTGVKLLTNSQKAQIQQQMQAAQAAALQAQQAGVPPPPTPPLPPDAERMMAEPSWDDVMGLLRNPALRQFRIDIETDSTIEPNDQEEKARRVEFVAAVGKYLADSLPVVQAAPEMLPIIIEGLKFLVRGFRVGREMEDVIERAADQLQKAASQPPAPPAPDPVEQAKAQAAQATAQAHQQQAQNDAQANQIEAARVQSDHTIGMAQVQAENMRTAADQHIQMQQAVERASERRLVHEINGPPPASNTP